MVMAEQGMGRVVIFAQRSPSRVSFVFRFTLKVTVGWRQLKNQVEMKHPSKETFKCSKGDRRIYMERERGERISPRTCVL